MEGKLLEAIYFVGKVIMNPARRTDSPLENMARPARETSSLQAIQEKVDEATSIAVANDKRFLAYLLGLARTEIATQLTKSKN